MTYYLSVLTFFLAYFIEPGGKSHVFKTLTSLNHFIKMFYIIAMQHLTVCPGGTNFTLALNQMKNANFTCECTAGIACTPPFWSLTNEGVIIVTSESSGDEGKFAERGITYSSSSTTAFITIPDTVENNNTIISCGALLFGGNEFSNPRVKLIIIGESELTKSSSQLPQATAWGDLFIFEIAVLLILFRSPSSS